MIKNGSHIGLPFFFTIQYRRGIHKTQSLAKPISPVDDTDGNRTNRFADTTGYGIASALLAVSVAFATKLGVALLAAACKPHAPSRQGGNKK